METITELITALFVFVLGLIFLLERFGWIKQQLSDWKAKRKGHTKVVPAVPTQVDKTGGEGKKEGLPHVGNSASQLLAFFSLLTFSLLFLQTTNLRW